MVEDGPGVWSTRWRRKVGVETQEKQMIEVDDKNETAR